MQSYPSPSDRVGDTGHPFYASSAGQQQSVLPNPDELQITAQLSRGLAPNMNAGHGSALSDSQDQRAQSQGNVNHQYEHQQDPHAGTSHVPGVQGSVDQMVGHYGTPEGSMAPRKRSKVSRACDECRRKKIRCDATGDPGDEACSSCKRVGTTCQFSRIPMKRGPSKGYIKELADRLNTLEGAMQAGEIPVAGQYLTHHESPLQRRGSEEFSPSPGVKHPPKKRTHSTISNSDFGTPYLPQRTPSNWPTHESPRHLPHPSSGHSSAALPTHTSQAFRDPNYSPNGLGPLPQWKSPPEATRRQSAAFESGMQDHGQSERITEWDDALVDSYYSIIHSTFPLLPHSKARLSSRLASCPAKLSESLYEALHAAIYSFPAPTPLPEQQSTRKAVQLWSTAQSEGVASRSFGTNLVYLQILLLLAIEAANRVPGATRGHAATSQSVWLGSAVGLAYELKLHEYKPSLTEDLDSDERLGRRIWWSLVVMDRWHASSMSTPLLIPDSSVVLMPEDQSLLGESLYHLTRLSIILGHSSAVTTAPADIPPLGVPPFAILGTLLRGELERWREVLPDTFFPPSNAPLIHLCYWYLRILLDLRQADSEPSNLLTPALTIVTQLTHNASLITPLTYHSAVLATTTLLKLTEYESTRAEAESGLTTLMENRIAPSAWDPTIRELISNRKYLMIPSLTSSVESQHASTAAQGLQHLAELATANEEGRDVSMAEGRKEGENFAAKAGATPKQVHQDLRDIVKSGYLRVLSGNSAR